MGHPEKKKSSEFQISTNNIPVTVLVNGQTQLNAALMGRPFKQPNQAQNNDLYFVRCCRIDRSSHGAFAIDQTCDCTQSGVSQLVEIYQPIWSEEQSDGDKQ